MKPWHGFKPLAHKTKGYRQDHGHDSPIPKKCTGNKEPNTPKEKFSRYPFFMRVKSGGNECPYLVQDYWGGKYNPAPEGHLEMGHESFRKSREHKARIRRQCLDYGIE